MGISMTKPLSRLPGSTGTYRLAMAMAVFTVLTACAGSDHSDLKAYVEGVNARQKPKIAPLPTFDPYPIHVYESGELRDPFAESAFVEQQVEVAVEGSGIRPPERDSREPLEEYPLDTLRMVGTLEQSATMWALIKDAEGSIHRVKTGNYMGKNYGKVLSINEHKVEILEIVPNGLGAYIERPATIALSE